MELEWPDGTTTQDTVLGTGRDVTDGQVELTVAVGAGDSGAGERRSGTEVTVTLVEAGRHGVLAVPVTAIVDDGGSPAVRVAQADGPDIAVPVQTGLVASAAARRRELRRAGRGPFPPRLTSRSPSMSHSEHAHGLEVRCEPIACA